MELCKKKKEIVIVNPFKLNRKKWMEEKVEDCEKISSREAKKKKLKREEMRFFFFVCSSDLFCFGPKQMGCRKRSKITWYAGHLFESTVLYLVIYLSIMSPHVSIYLSWFMFFFVLNLGFNFVLKTSESFLKFQFKDDLEIWIHFWNSFQGHLVWNFLNRAQNLGFNLSFKYEYILELISSPFSAVISWM